MGLFRRRARERRGLIRIHLADRLMPRHRHFLVEDRLIALLEAVGMEVDVYDAGTELDADRRLVSCDVALAVTLDRAEEAYDLVRAELARMPLVRGGTITLFSREILPVGTRAGLVLRVPLVTDVDYEDDGHVQHAWALDALRDRVLAALGDPAAVPSWEIDQGSGLMLAVVSEAEAMAALAPMLATDPLLEGATLTRYARGRV